jgi:methionyl-tRNA formyltransferase
MNMAFCTCVQLGLSCIEKIYQIGGGLQLMITLKDEKAKDKSGRIYLDDIANQHHVPLLKINSINDKAVIDSIQEYQIDWLFIIGWSQIAKSEVLSAPAKGCIGMHPTLLPKGRGRASIPWAILKGLDRTGVSMFKLDEGVDTGDILGQGIIEMHDDISATELYEKVNRMHIQLIERYWDDIVNDHLQPAKQNHAEATEWPGRKPEDGEIFPSMTIEEANRMVRAVTHPYPGAFHVMDGKKMIIWSASVSATEGKIKLKDGYLTPIMYEYVEV